MSINSFRKPFAVAASAALLSGGGGLSVARALADGSAPRPAPRERRAADPRPKASALRADAAPTARPSVPTGG